jgi:hypothetical protein
LSVVSIGSVAPASNGAVGSVWGGDNPTFASGHLFADPDLLEHDPASSEEMWRRVLAFLDRIDARVADVETGAR